MWVTLLIINALVGLAVFEFAWAATKRYRKLDELRDSRFPAWRRNDVKNWSRLKLYPTALTIMPFRVISFVVANVIVALINKVILLGLDLEKPIPVSRRNLTKIVFQIGAWLMSILLGTIPIYKTIDKDYSYWLGSDYKKVNKRPVNYRVPTYVSNHGSGWDPFLMIAILKADVSFLAKIEVKSIPFIGDGVIAQEGLFCPRGGTPEAKELTVQLIANRQLEIHEGRSTKSPLVIYPEGTTSNGTSILPFRRGAFQSLLPVQPLSVEYPNYNTVHLSNAIMLDHIVLILGCCNLLPTFVNITVYPVFEPTDYLWEKHADKGKEKWEIYAWAVRDIISKHTGLPAYDQHFSEQMQYFKYITGSAKSYLIDESAKKQD